MFERFSDRARRVLVLAQEEARLLNHNYIGTEHLLLGIIHEGESIGARALEALGISLDTARTQVKEQLGPAASTPAGSPPFTPRAKKVMELSLREARQLGHDYVGAEHLLLGVLREGDGVGAQVLVELGASTERVRAEVIRLLAAEQPADQPVRRWSEGEPATRFSVRAPSGAADTAVCPGCRIDLVDTLRWRTQEVPSSGPSDAIRDAVVWWCRACGRTISVTPDGAPRQARSTAVSEAIPESEEVRVQATDQGRQLASMAGDRGSDLLGQPTASREVSPPVPGERQRLLLEALRERIIETTSTGEALGFDKPQPGPGTAGEPGNSDQPAATGSPPIPPPGAAPVG